MGGGSGRRGVEDAGAVAVWGGDGGRRRPAPLAHGRDRSTRCSRPWFDSSLRRPGRRSRRPGGRAAGWRKGRRRGSMVVGRSGKRGGNEATPHDPWIHHRISDRGHPPVRLLAELRPRLASDRPSPERSKRRMVYGKLRMARCRHSVGAWCRDGAVAGSEARRVGIGGSPVVGRRRSADILPGEFRGGVSPGGGLPGASAGTEAEGELRFGAPVSALHEAWCRC